MSIIDIQYVFDRKIGSKSNFTNEEIEDLMAQGTIKSNADDVLQEAIEKLENQFKVKLKVVSK